MALVPINYVGGPGLITDVKPHLLVPNAWSGGSNIRMNDGSAQRFRSDLAAFDPPLVPPWQPFYIIHQNGNHWVYMGESKAYIAATVHTDITRVSGNYNADSAIGWNGCVLTGIPVMNNGIDPPQMWSPVGVAQPLQDLTNWPAGTTARVVRAFKNFLVALDITEGGTRYPFLVRWSDKADPGSVPSSWDVSDATKLAGQVDVAETQDFLVDCLPLGDINIIYKTETTWGMQFVGAPNVFRIFNIFGTVGMFTRGCAQAYKPGRHAVLTEDDFISHDGRDFESVIDGRRRRSLFQLIDSVSYEHTFVAHNQIYNEIWVCFPEAGETWCTRAFIWNYRENNWTERELPGVSGAAYHVVEDQGDDTWDGGPDVSWDGGPDIPWNAARANPALQQLLLASPRDTKLYAMGDVLGAENVFTAYARREGLAVEAVKPNGDITLNINSWKKLSSVWPRVTGDAGVQVKIVIGAQDFLNAPIRWEKTATFTPGVDQKIDCDISGKLFAWEISDVSGGTAYWQVDGMDMEVNHTSRY